MNQIKPVFAKNVKNSKMDDTKFVTLMSQDSKLEFHTTMFLAQITKLAFSFRNCNTVLLLDLFFLFCMCVCVKLT